MRSLTPQRSLETGPAHRTKRTTIRHLGDTKWPKKVRDSSRKPDQALSRVLVPKELNTLRILRLQTA
jgi:hypothetical protein